MNKYDLATFNIIKTLPMAAKNRHKLRFWDDFFVQYVFTKGIGCDKPDNAQCTLYNTILGNDSLKPLK